MDSVKVIRIDEAGFKNMQELWNSVLAGTDNSIFQNFDWARNWWDVYGGNKELLLLLCTERQHPIAIAPFVITREPFNRLPARKVELMYRTNLIITPTKEAVAVRGIMEYLKDIQRSWDIVDFSDMRDDKILIDLFKQEANRLGFEVLVKEDLPYPYIDITKPWDEYWLERKGKFKKNIRRAQRLIKERLQEVNYKFNIYNQADLDEKRLLSDFERLVELSMKSWKIRYGTALGSSPERKEFYKRLIEVFSRSGKVEISFLEHNAIPMAGLLAILYKDVWYFFLTFYDKSYAEFSPGTLLLCNVLERVYKDGVSRIELLKGLFPIKLPWFTGISNRVHIVIFKNTLRSNILKLSEEVIRPLIKGHSNVKDK